MTDILLAGVRSKGRLENWISSPAQQEMEVNRRI